MERHQHETRSEPIQTQLKPEAVIKMHPEFPYPEKTLFRGVFKDQFDPTRLALRQSRERAIDEVSRHRVQKSDHRLFR